MKAINKVFLIFFSIHFLSFSLLKGEEIKNWPREITSNEGKITIFQPEIESFSDNKMECRSAMVIKMDDQSSPVFGAIWYECRLATDRDNRTVTLLDLTIVADKFPAIEDTEVEKINFYVEQEVPQWEMVMSLDEILTGLEFNELINSSSEKLNNTAPEIIFATTPTALILIDGEPLWEQIENTNFEYVVNTPFFIIRAPETGMNYLKGGDNWYSSDNIYSGWKITEDVPRKLEKIESETVGEPESESTATVPSQIIVRTAPSELLLSNGSPQYSAVENTSLLFMTNTDDDIIMDINTQEYYVLISGRWYKSKDLYSDSWTFVAPDNLPENFSNIPEDSPINNVRVSVSGTQEAKEAMLETQIPQTAEIDREAAILEVFYDGDPIFKEIEGTEIMYAVNTDKDVLFFNNTYYCCDNAVWFESSSALGPWIVAIEIPREFMDIPPEYPVYNVKYVFIYDYTDEVVHSGYMQGYVHNYIYHGCVFYGTGYHYEPWHDNYYYPRTLTYGFNAHYNPYSGWGFSYGVSFEGFKWIDYDSRFHSNFEGYWGPSGYRHGYYRRVTLGKKRGFSDKKPEPPKKNRIKKDSPNHMIARNIATNNVYTKRNNGVSRTGDYRFNPKTGKQLSNNSSTTKRAKTSTRSNNLYSDETGNVYKRKNNGKWENKGNSSKTNNRNKTTTASNTRKATTANKNNNKPIDSGASTRRSVDNTNRTNTRNQSSSTNRTVPTNKKTQTKTTTSQNKNTAGRTSTQRNTTATKQQTNTKNNLNRQYESRNRSTQRTTNYNQNKTQNQYTKPQAKTTNTKNRATPVKSSPKQNRSSSGSTHPVKKR